jgi:hypothetical protein
VLWHSTNVCIIAAKEKYLPCLTDIPLARKYSAIQDCLCSSKRKKHQALAAIHSQNTTVENHLKYYQVFTLRIYIFMNNYTADDIYVLNTYYLHCYCQTEQQYTFLIAFFQYRGLVQEYFHYLDSGELPSQVSINNSSEDYLQDNYDY